MTKISIYTLTFCFCATASLSTLVGFWYGYKDGYTDAFTDDQKDLNSCVDQLKEDNKSFTDIKSQRDALQAQVAAGQAPNAADCPVEYLKLANKCEVQTDSLNSCTTTLGELTSSVKKAQQTADDDVDQFGEDIGVMDQQSQLIQQCEQIMPAESALHLAMTDHLNQVGLENLSLEADGLEFDGEQVVMDNCASGREGCQQLAMPVTFFDNGAFMLGQPAAMSSH